jgi:hypothetical protein
VIDEFEARSELVVQRVALVPSDIETAALGCSRGSDGGHDDVPARLDGARDLADISHASFRLRQEMEYGSVMPDVIGWASKENVVTSPYSQFTCAARVCSRARATSRAIDDTSRPDTFR